MLEIHPTAIVHPSATLGEGTQIGAYSLVGEGVSLGDHCRVHHHVSISGPTTIGSHNEFYPYASIGERTQDLKYAGEPTFLQIGDHNCFREFVTVHRATAPHGKTSIGNHGNFLAYAHIAHDCSVGDHVIFSNNGTLAGHVVVEDYVVIGGLSAVHQFCRLGAHALLGGCTKIVQDVPSFMIADGNPAQIRGVNQIGLERHGKTPAEIRELRDAYRIIYRESRNTTQALDILEQQYAKSMVIRELITFIACSKRGIIR